MPSLNLGEKESISTPNIGKSSEFGLSYGVTLNLGEYQFRKLNIGLSRIPCEWRDREKVYAKAKEFLEIVLQKIIDGQKSSEIDFSGLKELEIFSLVGLENPLEILVSQSETVSLENMQSSKVGMTWKQEFRGKNVTDCVKSVTQWIKEKIELEKKELLS